MATLTNSGTACLERTLDIEALAKDTNDLEVNYEIQRCVSWIKAGNFKKVCLQFPDELLVDAPAVARILTELLGFRVYILGDTTYGSCCVDEVAAEHIGADAVIHFGRTCLSPSKRIPVLYVFTRIFVDLSAVHSGLLKAVDDSMKKLIFVYDIRCHYVADSVVTKLQEYFSQLLSAELLLNYCDTISSEKGDSHLDGVTTITFNGRSVNLPSESSIKDYQFVYLGTSSPTLTSMLLRFSENTFYCIDPSDGSVECASGMRTVMSRNAKLEMAKDADIIGILVGTLGVADYRDVIVRLKHIIKSAGKRSYTFVVGKPNEPKLANIAEVDIFVYVSCPETAIVERLTDPALYKKLITPWELEVALLEEQEWSLQFESDFRELLPGGVRHVEMTSALQEETVNVSLLTNKTQRLGVRYVAEDPLDSKSGAVVLQNGLAIAELHVGGGGEILQGRTWQGLDSSVTAPVPVGHVVEGRAGIASIYVDENKSNTS